MEANLLVDEVSLLILGEVETECSARIHQVVGIEVLLERAVDIHLVLADLRLEPRSGHLAYAVVVAHRRAVLLDVVHDAALILEILVKVVHLRFEYEVEVCALGIEVGHMGHADGVGSALAEAADILVDVGEVIPVDRALEGVEHKAVVAHVLAQVGIGEATLLPALGDDAGGVHCTVLLAYLVYLLCDVLAEVLLALAPAEHEHTLAVLVALGGEHLVNNGVRNAVEAESYRSLLGVGETEDRREAELALHYLTRRVETVLPILENIGELLAVLGHILENSEGDMSKNAEGSLAAHHDLVYGRTGSVSRELVALDDADGSDILLADDDVFDFAVIARVLTCAAGDSPAADGGILEALREVAAGIGALCAEGRDGVVEGLFKLRTAHAGFDGYCLVVFAEGDNLVEVLSHVERDAALDCFNAAGDGGAAAVDIHRYLLLAAVFDKHDNILAVLGIDNSVGYILNDVLAKSHEVDHRLAVCDREPVIVVGADVCLADNRFESGNLVVAQAAGDIVINFFETHLLLDLEIVVGHVEGLLHQLIEL